MSFARNFDAVDDVISGTITAINSGDWSWIGWVKPGSKGENNLGRFMSVETSGAVEVQRFYMSNLAGDGRIGAEQASDSTFANTQTDTGTITNGVWSCVCAVFSASPATIAIYTGTASAVMTQAATTETAPTAMAGTRTTGGTNYRVGNRSTTDRTFDGPIGPHSFLPRALTTDEMEAFRLGYLPMLYAAGTPRVVWLFDSPTAATVVDYSGNDVTGTVTGATAVEGPPFQPFFGPGAMRVMAPADAGGSPQSISGLGGHTSAAVIGIHEITPGPVLLEHVALTSAAVIGSHTMTQGGGGMQSISGLGGLLSTAVIGVHSVGAAVHLHLPTVTDLPRKVSRNDPSHTPGGNALSRHFSRAPRVKFVIKTNGVWQTVDYPTQDQLDAAQKVYGWNPVVEVTPAEALELVAAGYTVT